MRPLSFARRAAGLLFGLAWVLMASQCLAQGPKPKPATFKTGDGVELQGTFYASARGKDAHCVMLLHGIGSDTQKGGWDGLAQELQKEEFAVLAFDFRGHGGSKSVSVGSPATVGQPAKHGFWDEAINRQMATKRAINPNQPPKTIDHNDFQAGYLPMLVNDIAAAKLFLDERNDAMECNSSRLIIIGAQDSAALGLIWMASECHRHKVLQYMPFGLPRLSGDSEGEALTCALWLSANSSIGNRRLPTDTWLKLLSQKYEVPMGFLYGEQDSTAATFAKHCVKILQQGNKNALTAERAIKGTKLAGAGLLNKQLDTTGSIVEYLKKVREDRKGPAWKAKKPGETGYFWTLPNSAPTVAKGEKDEVMNLVPLSRLLQQ